MATTKVLEAINEQVKYELYSSYLYLSMSAYFKDMGLSGFANWMRVQAKEEVTHAMKMYDYVQTRKGKIELLPIDAPPKTWKSPLDVLKAGLKHEEDVTARINKLVDLAVSNKDHASNNFLKWFVDEQVEEEDNFNDLVDKLTLIKNDANALLMMDKDLAARVFVDATAPAAADA